MANVRFNRSSSAPTSEALGQNPFDQLTLVRDTQGGTDYNSIYLGTALVGTSMIGLLKPQKMQTPTYTYSDQTTVTWGQATIGTGAGEIESGVITTDVVSSNPIVTVRKLIDFAAASAQDYSSSASDSEILTAKAVTALVASVADNTYYTAGGWGYTPPGGSATSWDTWTAVDSGTNGVHNFQFTLPIANTSSSGYDYTSDTQHIVTPAQVASFIGQSDIYHKTGTWGTGSSWNTYTAQAYKGSTPLTAQTNPLATAYELSFTLPVETGNIQKHGDPQDYYDNYMPTSKAVATFVAEYFSELAGGMRYCGSMSGSSQTPPNIPAGTKTGDVFIAIGDFIIPAPSGQSSPTWSVESGDMIVIKDISIPTASSQPLTADKCDVFERNLDGSITAASQIIENRMVVGAAGTNTVKTVSYVRADISNSDIVIEHTVGQTTTNISVADTLMWHDL